MSPLRSLARGILNVLDLGKAAQPDPGATTLDAVRQKSVPAVLGLSRFRDGFEQFPQGPLGTLRAASAENTYRATVDASTLQRDGFERSARTPVDLTGGVKPQYQVTEPAPQPAADVGAGFVASLDDIAGLLS